MALKAERSRPKGRGKTHCPGGSDRSSAAQKKVSPAMALCAGWRQDKRHSKETQGWGRGNPRKGGRTLSGVPVSEIGNYRRGYRNRTADEKTRAGGWLSCTLRGRSPPPEREKDVDKQEDGTSRRFFSGSFEKHHRAEGQPSVNATNDKRQKRRCSNRQKVREEHPPPFVTDRIGLWCSQHPRPTRGGRKPGRAGTPQGAQRSRVTEPCVRRRRPRQDRSGGRGDAENKETQVRAQQKTPSPGNCINEV